MSAILSLKENSAVQAHINMMQGMINRMASNSANCKLWCITILAAILGLFYDNKFPHLEYCYFIVGLFYFLDCFYLGLERRFVKEQNDYVKAINNNEESKVASQTFLPYSVQARTERSCWIDEKGKHFLKQLWGTVKALLSFSTTPFYGAILYAIYFILH